MRLGRAAVAVPASVAGGAGALWNGWAGHWAWTTVEVGPDDDGDAPSDTQVVAYGALFVDGTAYGRDGWTGTGPQATVYVEPVRSARGEPRRKDDVRTVEAATPPSAAPSDPAATASPSSPVSPSDRPE
ncbi:hypothetical protein ACWD4G_22610 [Streptomyces sp. NPDC002643]